jgi:beta-galactosidase GanA
MVGCIYFFVFLIFLCYPESDAGTFSVDYPGHRFLKDGKFFQYISGEVHYFRIHPDLWEDRLQRIRAAGLNAIQVYVPWNLHEPMPGM